MTLLYPSRRQMNMPTSGSCFAASTSFKLPQYVAQIPDKEHVEINRSSTRENIEVDRLHFTTYEELNFQLDGVTTDSSRQLSLDSSLKCTESSDIRSILKKSRSADSLHRDAISVALMHSTNVQCGMERGRAASASCSKNVTFADDKNQSLVEVRTFVPSLRGSDILSKSPDLSNNVFLNLNIHKEPFDCSMRKDANKRSLSVGGASWKPDLSLCFKEPCSQPNFQEKLFSRSICLEKCGTRNRLITGLVLVRNIEYKKQVFIRYTIDRWKTFSDTEAIYLSTVQEGAMDRFTFTLNLPTRSRELQFAICFKSSEHEFWDNNDNENYRVEDALQLQLAA